MFRGKLFNLSQQRKHVRSFSRNIVNRLECTVNKMPHPTSIPVFGTKLNFIFTGSGIRLHEYVDRRHKQLGPIFHESLGGSTELVFISEPNIMKSLFLSLEGKYPAHILPDAWLLYEKLYGSKRGLLFMDGEEWLHNRRTLNKLLLKDHAEKWLENPIKETILNFIEKWKKKADNDSFSPILESDFYRLSTDVIINVLLGHANSLKPSRHYEELLSRFSDAVKTIFITTTKMYGLPASWCQRLNLQKWKDFKASVDSTLLLAQKIINEILDASDMCPNGLIKKLRDEQMSREMIIRIAADFIIAAGDTSAYTTLWTLFLLSQSNSIVEEVRTKEKTYAKNVIRESMRLFPVAPFLTRILPQDSMLGPYSIEKNTPIIASIYTSGRDEQNFSRATEFLPYRWDRDDPRRKQLENHIPYASLPFAHGSRSCIGKKIAMLQMTEVITQVVNNFDLKCINKNEIKPITSQVLIPNRPIQLKISLRK